MKPEIRKILQMNAFNSEAYCPDCKSPLSRRLENLGAASVLFYREPIEMVRGKGCWMTSADGHHYLDFYNNVPSVGHCHPRVVQAISNQVALLNINTRYLTKVVDDYLESLKATFPDNLDNILLACTGSEANDLAMRIALKRTGQRGFIVTETAYHGNTYAVTEISPAARINTPLPDHVVSIPAPHLSCYPQGIAQGFGDAVEKAIKKLQSSGYGFAGFICDSIFSSDGVHSDPPEFLCRAVDLTKEHGGLYIADEVQPGFARTGSHMWGFQRHNVIPDIVTMGKPMGNGFPISGVAAQSSDIKLFCEDVGYFNTFGGNPVAAAAGQAVLDIIRDEQLMDNAWTIGNYIQDGLGNLQASHPVISEIRGSGLFIGVDLCRDGNPDEPAPSIATDIINTLKNHHILIGAAGKFGNTLKLRPPLCLTKHEADIFLNALEDTLGTINA